MPRSVYALAFIGLLATLMGIFGVAAESSVEDRNHRPFVEGETLTAANLGPTERIVIAYRFAGCRSWRERLYQIDGGPLHFAARALFPGEPTYEPPDDTTLAGPLADEEALGLDSYLTFLRYGLPGWCTASETVVVGYYRDGKKIGEERFRDDTCLTLDFHWENGKVVTWEKISPDHFPQEVFRTIVPPRLIEQRLNSAGRSFLNH